MENNQNLIKQQPESEAMSWFQVWSSFLTKSPFIHTESSETTQRVMQNVLEAMTQGDSCILASEDQVKELQDLVKHENDLTSNQVAPFVYDGQHLYLYRYWALEYSLAQQVARIKKQSINEIDVTPYLDLLEDPYQKQALEMVAKTGLNIITGGPGTGKTYTLARIIAVLNEAIPNIRIAMAAPTGKAAQRMKEALQNSFNDEKLSNLISDDLKRLTPITLHRLLGLGNTHRPKFNIQQPLPYDVIVIDEASMLDLNLANMLFSAIPENARLILLGDANQLASVDVGSVLADLQDVPVLEKNRVNLVTSRRFKDGALIGEMAKFIQDQQPNDDLQKVLGQFEQQVVQSGNLASVQLSPNMQDVLQLEYLPHEISHQFDWSEYYDKLMLGYENYIRALKAYIHADEPDLLVDNVVRVFDQYRILTAIRHGAVGLSQLNIQIEQRLLDALKFDTSKQGDWYIGRPVMMTYNDYQLGLSNGDIGICFKRERDGNAQFEVFFPSLEKWVIATRLPKNIETAFVLTIHKSQGSEFTHTAVVLDQMAKKLLSKELLYTAITRAKSVVSLLVDQESFVQSLSIRTTRRSGVLDKINDQFGL